MKILFLTHSFPWPLHEGVRLHVYHLLKELSAWHELHLLSFIEEAKERNFTTHLEPFCRSITLVTHRVPKQPWKRLWNIVMGDDPFSIDQFRSAEMDRALKDALERLRPDLLHVDFSVMAPYRQSVPALPAVFFPHDAMSMLFERNIGHDRDIFNQLYLASQARKMARFESKALPHFSRTIVVSPVDQAVLQSRAPGAIVESVPNGVDDAYFAPRPGGEKPILLFRGIMSFLPNLDAALFAIRSIMPLVWKKRPDALLSLVGPNVPSELRQAARRDSRIQLLGFVDDIRVPTAEAAVVLCPMRIGSGIKNKILESMAMGKALVATPMSLAGIDAQPGVHLAVGETAAQIAEQAVALLADPNKRQAMGTEARAFVQRHHTWRQHAQRFSEIYTAALKEKTP